jgi:polyribonucleotide 5'-hydroxyl-kinase
MKLHIFLRNQPRDNITNMAFSLPGLGLSTNTSFAAPSADTPSVAAQVARTEKLSERTEWRFEVTFGKQYTVKLTNGDAELRGTELAPNQTYTFSGYKGAIFTWQGCTLEVLGEAESEYLGQETEYAVEWLNVHGMLETLRNQAVAAGVQGEGPRVLVVGPDSVGKSSMVRSLAAWGVRVGRTPTVLNLDPRAGLLAPAGSLSAVTLGIQTEVESGYGMAPVSGPTAAPVKTPLVYSWPYTSPTEKPDAFKALLTHAALHVTGKLEANQDAKRSGLLIDTPGSLNDPKSNYDILSHIISEFSITLILTVGSERLYNDLNRRFNQSRGDDNAIPVLRLTKPGGAVESDATFLKQSRAQQVRQYFDGLSHTPLVPHRHVVPFSKLDIYRAKSATTSEEQSFKSGAADEDEDYEPDNSHEASDALFEKVTPSTALMASLVAIKFCPGTHVDEREIRDSAVMGFLYVADVDETKKRVTFLGPHPHMWGDRALVWGSLPEPIADLVT